MPPSIVRLGLAAAAVVMLAAPRAHADGVLPETASSDPSPLDVETALAITPHGTTRWSRVHFAAARRVLWLVPARPGAAVDFAPDAWLDALDGATAVRVVAPTDVPPCGFSAGPERVPSFGSPGTSVGATAATVLANEADARALVSSRGFAMSTPIAQQIAAIYGAGSVLVSFELASDGSTTAVSPTVRIADDGGALLPLALTGSRAAAVRVSAFVIGSTPATIDGATEIDGRDLTWGFAKSTFVARREAALTASSFSFLRESASHDALFAGASAARIDPLPSAASLYFTDAACVSRAVAAGSAKTSLGRICAPGEVAKIPGGSTCTPSAGTLDAVSVTCGASLDLALALSESTPSSAYVTRFAGFIAAGTVGTDVSLTAPAAERSPVLYANAYENCRPPPPTPPPTATPVVEPPHHHHTAYVTTGGCGGDTTAVETTDDDSADTEEQSAPSSGCGGDTSTSDSQDTSSSSDTCGGDSKTSSSDDSQSDDNSGWDKKDDESSSSSNDSCGGDSKKSESTSSALEKKPRQRHGKSPMSRAALAIAFVILPLRRRLRKL